MSETASERRERIIVGAHYMLGRDGFRRLLDEHFDGKIPAPDTGGWTQFIMATHLAPIADRPEPQRPYPKFPAALETADHFLPYDVLPAKVPEPFWIGFWSEADEPPPYQHADNRQAWENGRTLAKTKHAETYRRYVANCREVEAA